MRKYVLFCLISAVVFASCKKEEAQNNNPGISISKPIENQNLLNDYSFEVEGLASDDKNLAKIYYKLSSPDASYDYEYLDSAIIGGQDFDYTHWITLPADVAIGPAILEVWVRDLDGAESDHVQRSVYFYDNIEPVHDTLNSFIEDQDSVIVYFWPNEHGVYDSAEIWNYTKSTFMGTVTDDGGFRQISFYRGGEGGGQGWDPQEALFDFTQSTDNPAIAGITVELYPGYTGYYYGIPYLDIGFKQYHPTTTPSGHHDILYWIHP